MSKFKEWAPAGKLAAAVEERRPGTLLFVDKFMDNGHGWFRYQNQLGEQNDWSLQETVDHVFEKLKQEASQLIGPQVD